MVLALYGMALIIRRAFLVEELVWYFAQCWPHRIISSATLSDMAKEWTRTCAAAAAAAAAAGLYRPCRRRAEEEEKEVK